MRLIAWETNRQHEPDQQAIGALELAHEIGRRRHDQDLPGLPRTRREFAEQRDVFRTLVPEREVEPVGAAGGASADGFNNLRIVYVSPTGHLQPAIGDLDRLRRNRVGQQLAMFVGNDGNAVGAGFVPGKQLGKPAKGDVRRCNADEVLLHQDRIAQCNHRMAGIRVDERVGDGKRQASAHQLILGQGRAQIVVRGVNRIAAHGCGPGLVEGAMTLPVGAGRKVIDEIHVPLGIGRDSGVAAAAIIVDPRDHSMEAVLEGCIDGVDLWG